MSPAVEEFCIGARGLRVDIVGGQGPSAGGQGSGGALAHRRDDEDRAADVSRSGRVLASRTARVLARDLEKSSGARLVLTVPVDDGAAAEIASTRGRRIANRLLRRVPSFAQVRAAGTVTHDVARPRKLLEVDEHG